MASLTAHTPAIDVVRLAFIRPLNKRELEEDESCLAVSPPDAKRKVEWVVAMHRMGTLVGGYEFDRVFWHASGHEHSALKDTLGDTLTMNASLCRNTTLIVYGPPNTGKSAIFLGGGDKSAQSVDGQRIHGGLLFQMIRQIFHALASTQHVFLSVFEVSDGNESQCLDLTTGMLWSFEDVSRNRVRKLEDVFSLLERALSQRHYDTHLHIVTSVFDRKKKDVFDFTFVLLSCYSSVPSKSVAELAHLLKALEKRMDLKGLENRNNGSLQETFQCNGTIITLATCAPTSSSAVETRCALRLFAKRKIKSMESPVLPTLPAVVEGEARRLEQLKAMLKVSQKESSLLSYCVEQLVQLINEYDAADHIVVEKSGISSLVPSLIHDRVEFFQVVQDLVGRLQTFRENLRGARKQREREKQLAVPLEVSSEENGWRSHSDSAEKGVTGDEMEKATDKKGNQTKTRDTTNKTGSQIENGNPDKKNEVTTTAVQKKEKKPRSKRRKKKKHLGLDSSAVRVETKPNVLCCEDVKVSWKIYQAMLKRKGYKSVVAVNGEEAVEMYKKHCGTLQYVLMDIKMPLMDGTEATQLIRAFEVKQELEPKVILGLTGYVDRQDLENYAKCGMSGCIAKGKIIETAFIQAIKQLEALPEEFANFSDTEIRRKLLNVEKPRRDASPDTPDSKDSSGEDVQSLDPSPHPVPSWGQRNRSTDSPIIAEVRTAAHSSAVTTLDTSPGNDANKGVESDEGSTAEHDSMKRVPALSRIMRKSQLGPSASPPALMSFRRLLANKGQDDSNNDFDLVAALHHDEEETTQRRPNGGASSLTKTQLLSHLLADDEPAPAPVLSKRLAFNSTFWLEAQRAVLDFQPIEVNKLPQPLQSLSSLAVELVSKIDVAQVRLALMGSSTSPLLTPEKAPTKSAQRGGTQGGTQGTTTTEELKKKKKRKKVRKATNPSARPNVLVVEDVIVCRKLTQHILRKEPGFRVAVAADGEEAVDTFKKLNGSLELILMDVGLPGMDGLEATQLIREHERSQGYPYPPVIVFALTAATWEQNLFSYGEAGMNGCIRKGNLLHDSVNKALAELKTTPQRFVSLL